MHPSKGRRMPAATGESGITNEGLVGGGLCRERGGYLGVRGANLNPQPLPPGEEPDATAACATCTGSGSGSNGGASSSGSNSSGSSGAFGGASDGGMTAATGDAGRSPGLADASRDGEVGPTDMGDAEGADAGDAGSTEGDAADATLDAPPRGTRRQQRVVGDQRGFRLATRLTYSSSRLVVKSA